MRLTNSSVAALDLPPGKDRLMVYDDDVKGFGVRVSRSNKQWFVQYRTLAGESRRETLGKVGLLSATDARKAAADRLLRVRSGDDRIRTRVQQAPTIGSLIDPYLAERKGQVSDAWLDNMRRYLKVDLAPLHRIAARDLTRADVHKQLQALKRDSGATTANRTRATLSRFYSWLIATDVVDNNVVAGTERPSAERTRERVLKPAELAAIWKACTVEELDDFADIVRLLLLTGQRRQEVAAMGWSELDLAAGLWSLPGERTKNGLPHDVPLSAQALDVLARRPTMEDERPFVFGRRSGPFSGFSKAKLALDKRAKVTGWRLHDLRRTAATVMAETLKVQPHIIEAVLNHISGSRAGVAGIYNRAQYSDEKRAALDLWGRYVAGL